MATTNKVPIICFFKCGISPELEFSREYKMKLAKAAKQQQQQQGNTNSFQQGQPEVRPRGVTIGLTRMAKATSFDDCFWEGSILVKTPEDVDEDTLSNAVIPFCFPEGIKAYSAEKAPRSICYTFTLTSIKGDKSYVTCIIRYEVFEDAATVEKKYPGRVFGEFPVVPVCYCLMSRVICTEFSRAWLLKYINAGTDRPKMVARVLTHKTGDLLIEGSEVLPEIPRPNPMDIPFIEGNVYWLFHQLDAKLIVDVFFWLLEEQKVIFLSDDVALLGQCIATMSGLLYPFTWVCHQISPLPAALIETTQGPGALFHGMLRRAYEGLPGKQGLGNLVVVDLDAGVVVRGPEETYLQPPESDKAMLVRRLEEAYQLFSGLGGLEWCPGRVPGVERGVALHLRVRGIFLSYFAEMLQTYRSYMLPLRVYPREALSFRFVDNAFVRTVDAVRREYAGLLILNQLFQYFIENRPWPVGDAFDAAIAGEIWKVPVADLPDFMTELSAAVAPPSPYLRLKQVGQVRATAVTATNGTFNGTRPSGAKLGGAEGAPKRFGLKRWVCREIRSVPQSRVGRAYAERVRATISSAVPDFYRIQPDGERELEGLLGTSYGRLLVCETFFRAVERSGRSNQWDVSVPAWEALGDLFTAVIIRAYEDADYLALRYATEVIKECRTYKNGNHGLYERCLCNDAVTAVYRDSAVWERMFACSMAEIYRKKYCPTNVSQQQQQQQKSSQKSAFSSPPGKGLLGEDMYGIPAAQQQEYGEAEWALARAEFVYFAQVMEAFGAGDDVHRIISSSIVNFDFDKCNGLIEELKPQEAYRRKETVQRSPVLPYGLENATALLLWVDDKLGDANVSIVRSSVVRYIPGFEIVHLASSDSLRIWLTKYAHLRPGKIKVVTNFYRAFDGGEHAAHRVLSILRKDAEFREIPIMIFCGNSSLGEAQTIAAGDKNCKASKDSIDLVSFCLAGVQTKDDSFLSKS